jgi:phage-related minor tail protein
MSERKFTDEEVIKAFECHTKRNCGDCPMCGKGCADKLIEVAHELINQQKAEIERLRNTVKTDFLTVTEKLKFSQSEIGEIRAEAIKEFAEKLKDKLLSKGFYPVILKNSIQEVIEEMTEVGK